MLLYIGVMFHLFQMTALLLMAVLCLDSVAAQPPQMMRCDTICPTEPPYHNPTVTITSDSRIINTTQCPPYTKGWTNPNDACMVQKTYVLPLKPRYAKVPISVGEALARYNDILYLETDPAPVLGSLGVLLNGVNVYGVGSPCGFNSNCPNTDPSAPSEYVDAVESEGITTDSCGGHADPNGFYHIHQLATQHADSQRKACELPSDTVGNHSELLGWMLDGFGLYGPNSQGGVKPTQLDECGGHTHEIDGNMTYHYHVPDSFPWTIGCLKGCPATTGNTMLSAVANNATYGCPEGLEEDPNPVFEQSGVTGGGNIAVVYSLSSAFMLVVVCMVLTCLT